MFAEKLPLGRLYYLFVLSLLLSSASLSGCLQDQECQQACDQDAFIKPVGCSCDDNALFRSLAVSQVTNEAAFALIAPEALDLKFLPESSTCPDLSSAVQRQYNILKEAGSSQLSRRLATGRLLLGVTTNGGQAGVPILGQKLRGRSIKGVRATRYRSRELIPSCVVSSVLVSRSPVLSVSSSAVAARATVSCPTSGFKCRAYFHGRKVTGPRLLVHR